MKILLLPSLLNKIIGSVVWWVGGLVVGGWLVGGSVVGGFNKTPKNDSESFSSISDISLCFHVVY